MSELTRDELLAYVEAFQTRLNSSDECVHAIFTEVGDDATYQLAEMFTYELGAAIAAGADGEEMYSAVMHAFHTLAAFGYGLGALQTAGMSTDFHDTLESLSTRPTTDDGDPASAEWAETLRIASEADWL